MEPNNLPDSLKSKALIAYRDSRNRLRSAGGDFLFGMLTTTVKNFGSFYITIDTIAPTISALNIYNNKNMSREKSIKLKVTDNLAGIDTWEAFINDEWVVMEYEPKQALFFYDFEKDFPDGVHEFAFRVKDGRGNESEFKSTFKR